MRKEEMRKIVNLELKSLLPSGLTGEGEKLWRFLFNMLRQNDLAQQNPKGGGFISSECIKQLKEKNPEVFLG
ncbi:MAG: hypothetical protein ACKKMV_03510 [Candidatus Nealsonbacteria bacterium]